MRRRLGLALLTLLPGACMVDNYVASTEGPLVFTLSADSAWSGGTVAVTATRFAELVYTPVFVSGADTLAATRTGDSTYTVRIPVGRAGPVPIAIQEGTRRFEVGTVTRAGFAELNWYTPGFDFSMLIQARRHSVPVVLGNGSAGITLFYPSLRRAERLTGFRAPAVYYGIGQSYVGGEFILRDSTGALGVWELWPSPLKRRPALGSTSRQMAQLGPTVFLYTYSHGTMTTDTTPPIQGYGPFDTEDSWNIHLSPRGDRAVIRSTASNGGVPVINSLSGDTAYLLPMRSLAAADFTPDGAEFVAAGRFPGSGDSLRRIEATTGATVVAGPLPDSAYITNLQVDPGRRWVFLMIERPECVPGIVVYDFATMRPVGDLRGPPTSPGGSCGNRGWEGLLVHDTAPDRLYLLWNGEPLPVFEFTVLP
ncbi:MAG: hypothetical protein IPK12_21515 [Gemmatimonadetes bacterium]|nr:hypothetical protein [Gemmatimonadota bacterium]